MSRSEPDFASLGLADLVLCHNEMIRTAAALGLKARAVETFAGAEEGAQACARLYAGIRRARAKRLAKAPGKRKRPDRLSRRRVPTKRRRVRARK